MISSKKNNIKIYETGNLDNKYVLEDGSANKKIMPRVKNFINFNEYRKVYRILKKQKPDILMAYNNSTLTPVIMWRYKLYCKLHNINIKLILKLDNDGSDHAHTLHQWL